MSATISYYAKVEIAIPKVAHFAKHRQTQSQQCKIGKLKVSELTKRYKMLKGASKRAFDAVFRVSEQRRVDWISQDNVILLVCCAKPVQDNLASDPVA